MALTKRMFVMRGFSCTTDAMISARVCEAAGAAVRLVPRPAAMGNAECGTAMRSLPEQEEIVARALEDVGVVPADQITLEDYQ